MTNRLIELLAHDAGARPLSMCHFVAGFPTVAESEKIARVLIEGGGDILEIQIPFSDPMADGPSIASACQDALVCGMDVKKTLALAKKLSKAKTPLVLMSYINPVYRYGIARFVRDAARAGISGLIIPDSPFDSPEGVALIAEARKHALCMIPVISPGVSIERMRELSQGASGFVYCTSRQGTTGANSTFALDLKKTIADARQAFEIPIGLGFGVKTRADFKSASRLADITIAGSVFVNAIREANKNPSKAVQKKLESLLS